MLITGCQHKIENQQIQLNIGTGYSEKVEYKHFFP